jgi:hypothetical protein
MEITYGTKEFMDFLLRYEHRLRLEGQKAGGGVRSGRSGEPLGAPH